MRDWILRLRLLAFTLGVASTAHAHVLDEYLQATLVVIEPGEIRLSVNLTPGIEVADKILDHIDRDKDGTISSSESAAYVDMVKRDLTVQLDGRVASLQLIAAQFPELSELRTGHGMIELEFAVSSQSFTAGEHRLAFETRHLDAWGVYLLNAARPRSDAIHITRQSRNTNQSKGEIEFVYDSPQGVSKMGVASAVGALAAILVAGWYVSRTLMAARHASTVCGSQVSPISRNALASGSGDDVSDEEIVG